MDEILIGEKKYVSSKQAAKVTGYAKDYIGQLCREGRVPARLVGRSWYVLESAIHDHRFGNPKDESVETVKTIAEPPIQSTWESPRYEAGGDAEILPSVNRLHDHKKETSEQIDVAQNLQDTWQAWFDRFEPVLDDKLVEKNEEPEREEPEIEKVQDQEVNIPIHTIYQLPPENLLPHRHKEIREDEPYEPRKEHPQRRGRGAITFMQMAGATVALIMASLAVLGSGYLDRYIISNSQVGIIAGVAFYNR